MVARECFPLFELSNYCCSIKRRGKNKIDENLSVLSYPFMRLYSTEDDNFQDSKCDGEEENFIKIFS